MKKITIQKPVIDLKSTGTKIKEIRKARGFSVRDIQEIFGFEYPQAVYAWEQGKNVPTIDNLLVLAQLFDVAVEQMLATRMIEVEITCSSDKLEKFCTKKCDACKYKLTA